MEFRRGKYEATSRGGKGFEAVKRTDLRPRRAAADRAGRLGRGRRDKRTDANEREAGSSRS